MNQSMTIICGPAGYGKTTLATKLWRENKTGNLMFIYEADQWMMENGQYKFDPMKLGYCHRMCQENTERALADGHSVIVSNTTLRRKDLNVYLDIAAAHSVPVRVIKMQQEYGSVHNVPDFKVEMMKKLWNEFDWKDLPDFVTVEDYIS
jgi:predicted kinase